ncbi:NAD-glutamate dehydrogenase [Nitrincola tapanii]|uniref:NAD-glutamate dehydrogenase n=1 Tax=Nitrincola tapanii TaxID=1708751 RepID=A0A5A9W8F5_9GAMM|nr:NAD-glutamate dehydrogenase [Nitrincola tapanii]KAA0875761.1 NAD-glutamate dehydrogenase [Nitrincola tapanii]
MLSHLELKLALKTQLITHIQELFEPERAEVLTAFVEHFFRHFPERDLKLWRSDDLLGAILDLWSFFEDSDDRAPQVRVFNPSFEQDGWQSLHSVVFVRSTDMPFLVDSLRIALNHLDLSIHSIHNMQLPIRRQGAKAVIEALEPLEASLESLIFIEVDRHTEHLRLTRIQQELVKVLEEVRDAVKDFAAMRVALLEQSEAFATYAERFPDHDFSEVQAFITWLERHFTFLGYEVLDRVPKDQGLGLQPVPDTGLGLLSACDASCRRALLDEVVELHEWVHFTKANDRSRVHRPAYPDVISFKRLDDQGEIIGEVRFLGLYTSSVYFQSAYDIPIVRDKIQRVMQASNLMPQGHDWKTLNQILQTFPRDDLFQISAQALAEVAISILEIRERRQIRVFIRRDTLGHYFSVLVYVPRDIYSTEFRIAVETLLKQALACDQAEFTTYFSESVLARTQFILRSSQRQALTYEYDVEEIEQQIRNAARSWDEDFHHALIEALGEEQGLQRFNEFSRGFPASYRSHFSPRTAVVDLQHMWPLSAANPIALSFYRAFDRDEGTLNFKLFHLQDSLPLSDVIPILENLGLRVMDEHPYEIEAGGRTLWIHDFNLCYGGQYDLPRQTLQSNFEEAFLQIWSGHTLSDDFNKLVLGAGLTWTQVRILRAYAAYMKQIRFPISTEAVSAALNQHAGITHDLVQLFYARFEPGQGQQEAQEVIEARILSALEEVSSLNEDQVIRQYVLLIKATVRTTYFQSAGQGPKPYLAFKLLPAEIPNLPEPRPLYEIFVFSPQVEGVHLRGGKVARGGLRWSDRKEDYRTEVLGLVKAQQVKNAVIVPVGAKGGFIAKRLHPQMTRDQWLEEGIASYRLFISALLDLTDNLLEGQVVPPADLVRHDEDDTYLVVAADKGTATFSDIANEIAQAYGFWLGDAFASGGSQGYDHKKMGITARGAWVSVERHFREMGHNTRTQPFRVIGIGDMSGDVFGNGMLLSQQIQLVAAFNHQHIFIDPNPDPASSFAERQRLFQLPRSGWNDYDKNLISAGGGVFDRAAKSIPLSAEVKHLTGLTVNRITPNELISALLQAPVDLLWNGGIGTYIKASSEQHTDVGDKANDALRVDASSLRCKVIGEGGNLGMTQKGRMEYARLGGRLNTDFIDNAGGVDCSDHEVNIKIMLNEMLAAGDITLKQRNTLLQEMTDEVAALVLRNNYRQVQALTLAQRRSLIAMAEYQRFINKLEAQGKLKRSLEFIPNDEQLEAQRLAGLGLSRPELSVLVSYSKADLKERLLATDLPLDPYVARERVTAFPAQLQARYPQAMAQHRLSREIVATQVANQIVNLMGINFVDRLTTSTGADVERVTRAYILVRDVFDVLSVWQEIEYLDYQVDANIQLEMMERLQYLVRHATRWFIRNRRGELDCEQEQQRFYQPLKQMGQELGELLCGEPRQEWEAVYERYREAQVPEALAKLMAGVSYLFPALGVIEVALENEVSLRRAAEAFYAIGERLELHWFAQQLNRLEVDTYWQALARDAFRDDLDWQQRALMTTLLRYPEEQPIQHQIDQWVAQNQPLLERWDRVLVDLKNAKNQDYAMYTVAVRELFDLARTCIYTQN